MHTVPPQLLLSFRQVVACASIHAFRVGRSISRQKQILHSILHKTSRMYDGLSRRDSTARVTAGTDTSLGTAKVYIRLLV
jgi:hypothetical protein